MRGVRASAIFFFLIAISGPGRAEKSLCPHIVLHEGRLDLNENERVLVCGSSKGEEGWESVPLPQAQYQLNVILQNKGYLNARFEREGDRLSVWSGPRTRISGFEVRGGVPPLQPEKKRQVVGEPLEPVKLNEVERWADLGLRSHGHACPELAVQAQGWNGLVRVEAEPGPRQKIVGLEYKGLDGLDPRALERYRPFESGDWYDVRKTQIMTMRMMADGLFQSAYFVTHCRSDIVDLELNAAVGKPRLIRFGVGASTEEFPFADIWFRNARLDDQASSVSASIHASPREQSLTVSSELYWLSFLREAFLGPRFRVAREVERSYEVIQARLGGDLGRSWDEWDMRIQGRVGPTLNFTKTVEGVGPDDTYYLSWEGSLFVMNHQYEVFMRDQYEGWTGGLRYRGQRKGLGSEINADRYDIDLKSLWNVGGFSPPLFVLGTRVETVLVDADQIDQGNTRNLLPIEYRLFYGGDRNLRGFARQILTNGGLGYLTAAYVGFELRLIEELPYRLQPFLLYDIARLGNRRLALDPPVFVSEGAGLRWASPFGTIRGSAARGRIFAADESTGGYPREWIYFFSFGQEF